MQRDFRQTTPKVKAKSHLLISAILVMMILFLSFLAIKLELGKLYQLKEDERVLLVHEGKPLAILFFNVNNKQLLITDLREVNFDYQSLNKEASFSGDLDQKLLYSFFFNTAFDQKFDYPSKNLDKESLLKFFKKQKIYYFFLKDQQLFWREQDYSREDNYIVKPVFDCSVSLINTTGESGLATSLAKMLEKSSFSIIRKDDNSENLVQTKIIYDPEEQSCAELLRKLDRVLPQSLIVANREAALEERAAMVIYIGRDLADLYLFFVNLFHSQL